MTYEFLYNYLEIIRFYSVKQITLLVVKRLFYVINFGVVYKSHMTRSCVSFAQRRERFPGQNRPTKS